MDDMELQRLNFSRCIFVQKNEVPKPGPQKLFFIFLGEQFNNHALFTVISDGIVTKSNQ